MSVIPLVVNQALVISIVTSPKKMMFAVQLTSLSVNLVHLTSWSIMLVCQVHRVCSSCLDIRSAYISEFEKLFDVNVKGVFLGMKHAARIMIPLKKGSIISLRSVASALGGLGSHAYAGSKHAILGLTKNVGTELGLHGIRVDCVSPYAILTGLALTHLLEEERTKDAMAGFRDFTGRNANLQGVELTTTDVANDVLFLASDEARYVSGANLKVDGGFTCSNHSLRVCR
ncbi:xanthoxin dehydrogenase-like [Juglans regia]|uniref:Xanthoxin dehydrogenase-like n=1 Tax=Juglans regia TaxID=51240 RepID=A0A6P9ECT7_JUGRE|nr:xanthoxin dehydrogenase-like [Juglans regia]